MRKQDFYSLPRAIQDRFIVSSQAVAAPAALAVAPLSEKRSLFWGLGSVVCAVGWGGFTTLGFGDLSSPFALGSPVHKVIHIAFAAAVIACALRAYLLSWAVGRLPYGTGYYLFPSGVVMARGAFLLEYDSGALASARSSGATVSVQFKDGGSFEFPARDAEHAAAIVEKFEAGATAWKGLADAKPLERARLNPLIESGVPNPLAPTQPHVRPVLIAFPALLGIIVVLAVGLGLSVSGSRDSMSRKALYASAVSRDTVAAYQAYLERGGERTEVRELLLPRAELKQAVEQGTVEAILAFKEKNPDLQIGGEVQNALRAGLLSELAKAQAKGTLSAIEEVPKRFPAHELIAGEISAARRAVYAKAMANFQSQASPGQEELIPFVQKLLTYAETHGPRVELRFSHDFPQDPKMLDQIVSKSKKYYMGQKSLPSQYFLGEDARRREAVFLKGVQARLQKAFPPDILRFELGPPAPADGAALPAITSPTITFLHRERLSGGFVGGVPKAMYLGAAILIGSEGALPGDSEPSMIFNWNAWRAPDFSVLSDRDKDMPDVYEDMMMGAFNKYQELYLARWFAQP